MTQPLADVVAWIRRSMASLWRVMRSARHPSDGNARSLALLEDLALLTRTVEERSRVLESLALALDERSRTLEYMLTNVNHTSGHLNDQVLGLYVETKARWLAQSAQPCFNAADTIELVTAHPIALDSNDHIHPDSTVEGLPRPTRFVQDCIRVMGPNVTCLDLGSGAGGLVYECAMNQLLAIGIDGSDFCRVNRVGYWPLLAKNMFTCDITQPFRFRNRSDGSPVRFGVITMWEVLEHIAEERVGAVLDNIRCHLDAGGYFIGSVSLVEYVDHAGQPYHVTLKPRAWWRARFQEHGLRMLDRHPFHEHFFCRGNGPRYQDHHNYAKEPDAGFLFVAQARSEQ